MEVAAAVETADQVAVPDLVAVTSGEIGAVVGMVAAVALMVVVDMGGHRDMVVAMEAVAAAAAAMVVVRV